MVLVFVFDRRPRLKTPKLRYYTTSTSTTIMVCNLNCYSSRGILHPRPCPEHQETGASPVVVHLVVRRDSA